MSIIVPKHYNDSERQRKKGEGIKQEKGMRWIQNFCKWVQQKNLHGDQPLQI